MQGIRNISAAYLNRRLIANEESRPAPKAAAPIAKHLGFSIGCLARLVGLSCEREGPFGNNEEAAPSRKQNARIRKFRMGSDGSDRFR
eukprot:1328118-Amorphochlora_amoeboformis.AAC.1